jgi:2-amino-4-hydroxy-6-hydroxymethyldihydropteridine diphosphokinase
MIAEPHWIFLGLGANIGDRVGQIKTALALLSSLKGWRLRAASSLYETPAWGKTDQPAFLNQVVAIEIDSSPQQFLADIQAVEAALGRTREERWGPRTIDLDILAWGQEVLNSKNLAVPHPAIAQRAFVLVPWAEIAPDFRLPGSEATIAELLAALPAEEIQAVRRYEE